MLCKTELPDAKHYKKMKIKQKTQKRARKWSIDTKNNTKQEDYLLVAAGWS